MYFSVKKNTFAVILCVLLAVLTACGREPAVDSNQPPTAIEATSHPSLALEDPESAKVTCSGQNIVYYDWTDLLDASSSQILSVGQSSADASMGEIDMLQARQVWDSMQQPYVLPYAVPVGCGYRAVAISDVEGGATAIDSFTVTFLHESDTEQLHHRVEVGYETYVIHPDTPTKMG